MSFQPRDLVVVVPGIAALGVGLLYGAGAVIKSGQLRGADLNVRDTLPLVPLEQILAIGIGTLVTSLVWVVIFAFLLWAYLGLNRPDDVNPSLVRGPLSPRARRFWKGLRIVTWTLIGASIVGQFYTQPFFSAVAVSAAILLGIVVDRVRVRGRRYVLYVLVAYFLIVLGAQTGTAYVSPAPLPEATLHLRNEPKPVRGTLIVHDGSNWYLSLHEGTYRAIPELRIATAVVRSRSNRHEPRPMLKVVRREIESWFGG